jgi:aldehyde:ferredoxin oxidoreductase
LTTDTLGADNCLIGFSGPLSGTVAPTSGRFVFVSASPRLYPIPWVTHSTMGGWFSGALKFAGFDGFVIRGRCPRPSYLLVDNGRVELHGAEDLWGRGTRETQKELKLRHGGAAQVACIGPAGEHLARMAVIHHADENASGHSGFGAVMGSKNLKAIVVLGSGSVQVAQPARLIEEFKRTRDIAWVSPIDGFFDDMWARTAEVPKRTEREPVCSQSCSIDCLLVALERDPDGQDVLTNCVGEVWMTGADQTEYEGGDLKVPAGKSFGRTGGMRTHDACNELGLDLWLLQTMQPWFLKCMEEGVSSLRGVELDPTDPDWFIAFLEDLAHRRGGLGEVFADGLRRALDELQKEVPDAVIRTGQSLEFAFGFPAHREGRLWDPEPMPFWAISALMYASESRDPSIGTHNSTLILADLFLHDPQPSRAKFRELSKELFGSDQAFEPTCSSLSVRCSE